MASTEQNVCSISVWKVLKNNLIKIKKGQAALLVIVFRKRKYFEALRICFLMSTRNEMKHGTLPTTTRKRNYPKRY